MQPNANASLVNQKHILLMAQILNKMGRFFQDMAYDCMQHLSPATLHPAPKEHTPPENHLQKTFAQETENFKKKNANLAKVKSHKPKHPVSSFFIFYKEKGQEIAKERGEILGCKIAKIVGELWKSMSDAQKEPYEAKAKAARQKYEQQMVEYKIKYTDEIERLKNYKRMVRIKRKEAQQLQSKSEKQTSKAQSSVVSQEASLDQKEEQEEESEESESASKPSQQSGSQLEDGLSDSLQITSKQFQGSSEINDPTEQRAGDELQQQNLKIEQEDGYDYSLIPSSDALGQLDYLLKERHQASRPQPVANHHPSAQSMGQSLQTYTDTDSDNSQQSLDQKGQSSHLGKPKAPISSFFLFYKAKGKQIAKKKGIAAGPELIKAASLVWKSMSAAQKKVYEEQARMSYAEALKDIPIRQQGVGRGLIKEDKKQARKGSKHPKKIGSQQGQ